MRRYLSFAFLVLFATVAFGQETPAPPQSPNYSRDALLQIFANEAERGKAEPRIQHSFGQISFKALGMRWRIGYLPFFVPLPGSRPWLNSDRWPDPFLLTRTEFASPPRTWRQSRDMSAELRRIERRVKDKATVKVKPE